MKAEVYKLDINKLTNVPISLNNKNNLDVDKVKIVPVDLKKLSYVADNKVVTITNFIS